MSKCIWLYSRKPLSNSVEERIIDICNRISPDNITPRVPKVKVAGNCAYGIMNPTNTILINGNSIMLGKMIGQDANWHKPGSDFPEGIFALFRDGEKFCEIVTDPVATRTIWYYYDEDFFIASTSQRAIILFIGGFEFDDRVIPWMLSTGSLGPTLSWDKRINRVPPDTSVILEKANWALRVNQKPIEFMESNLSDKVHEENLKVALNETFGSIMFDFNDWVLPLSGGYDSRGILCLLKSQNNADGIKTVTWGLKTSIKNKKNDAYIAAELSKKLNIQHRYFCTDIADEPAQLILNRFLINGEGRVDHVAGYMDGFKIWKHLFEDNVQGIIRGDEAFGWTKVISQSEVKKSLGFTICQDYSNLNNILAKSSINQEIPAILEQREGESISTWRDRLFQTDRIATVSAALSDLKLSYVEVVNPLLTRKILYQVRTLPDHLRTLKVLYKKIVISICPKVPFATVGANADNSGVFKLRLIVDLLKNEISSIDALNSFSAEFIKDVLNNIKILDEAQLKKERKGSVISLKSIIKQLMPSSIKNIIKSKVLSAPTLDYNILAFRMYIVLRMRKLLTDGHF